VLLLHPVAPLVEPVVHLLCHFREVLRRHREGRQEEDQKVQHEYDGGDDGPLPLRGVRGPVEVEHQSVLQHHELRAEREKLRKRGTNLARELVPKVPG